jgi:hypothetical protein
MNLARRLLAGGIAAVAWIGLFIQFAELHRKNGALLALWIMLAYFTILTNALVAVVFTCVALDRTALRAPRVIAGVVISILLVGVVVFFLLRGLLELSGGSALVDLLLHQVTPVGALLFWLFATRKGSLTWRDPLLWAIYPLAYFGYALARGAASGQYAYPFMNVAALGWARTGLNAFVIAVGFVLTGYAFVGIDSYCGRPSAIS